ncbi:AAA family ATPase [Streptomyces sp. NPDC126514]|uniref:helix-turn-helix transcriptional regulator n=1 Tax=Streptomyces sp. NPDC126514 TaxID=3155210 RepID=UPI00333440F8
MDADPRDVVASTTDAGTPTVVPGALWEGFAGRSQQLEAIGRCRAEAAAGTPWVVVIEGEPGIGKTALARRALAPGPDGTRVCWSGCDRSEQDYPFGVVDQLLRRLPRTATGAQNPVSSPSPAASPFAVGADLLTALAAAAEAAPLAVVIDDVAWADDASLKVLSFLLRRLHSEPVLLVVTARTGDTGTSTGPAGRPGEATPQDWDVLTRGAAHVLPLRLTGLTAEETGRVAAAAGCRGLGRAALDRLWEHTAGNPLYLRSLIAEGGPGALADLTRALPVPSTLNALVRHTLNRLPADARRLIEALAVLDATTPLTTTAQLADLPDATAALDAALASGLIQWQPDQPTTPLRIHHPLQRDAVYQAITPLRRRALHTTAATLADPDRAWDHEVAAATGADLELASRLAAEADRQAARGSHHRAATLELWAADLSPTRDAREHHLIAAATRLLAAQAIARATTLREDVQRCAPGPARDAALGYMAAMGGDLVTAERLLAPAAAVATDPATRLTAAVWLGGIHLLRGDGPRAAAVLRPVVDQIPPGPAAHTARGFLASAASAADGASAGLAVMAGVGLPEQANQVAHADSALLTYRGFVRVWAGHLGSGVDDLGTLTARQRTDGNIIVYPEEHYMLGFGRYLTGRWEDAVISAGHAVLVADTLEQPHGLAPGHAAAAMVHAQQGHRPQAESHIAASRQSAGLFPELTGLYPVLAEAVLAQTRADWPAMRRALHSLGDPAAPVLRLRQVLWLPLYVEALTASDHRPPAGDLRQAGVALAVFDRLADHAPALVATSHWLNGRLAATQGDTETAQSHYRAGLTTPARDGDDIPLHRGFLHHDLARLLLVAAGSTGGHKEAAHHLQQAYHAYTALGAGPHAQRAIHDLNLHHPATPATPAGPPDLTAVLTEREHAVAHLAAQAMTNNEIARELFVSPKTVEYHLGHVYTKLRLTGRRQLRHALQPTAGGHHRAVPAL